MTGLPSFDRLFEYRGMVERAKLPSSLKSTSQRRYGAQQASLAAKRRALSRAGGFNNAHTQAWIYVPVQYTSV